MDKATWIWMPHAAYFICGNDCRFRLATFIPARTGLTLPENMKDTDTEALVSRFAVGAIISTVGEYWPDSEVRRIHAEVRNVTLPGRGDEWDAAFLKRFGYIEIGCDRTFETMVFPAKPSENKCCPFRAVHKGGESESDVYNDADAATVGHMAMCEKWATKFDQWAAGQGIVTIDLDSKS